MIAPSTNLFLGIFSLRNEVNNPGHQELTQTDISNMDTFVCYFAGALIAATKCLHSPSPWDSLSCAACAIRVMWFERRLSRLRHRHALTVKAWEEAVQGQGNVFTSSNFHMSDYRKWSYKRPRCLFNFRGPGRWKAFKTERDVYSHNYNKHNKTSTFSAKKIKRV